MATLKELYTTLKSLREMNLLDLSTKKVIGDDYNWAKNNKIWHF